MMKSFYILMLTCLANVSSSTFAIAAGITLADLEQLAMDKDPAQQVYQAQQSAFIAQGKSANTLADPMIKLGLANVPTDNFSLDSDPMTQLSVGISQQFNRGSQLAVKQQGFMQQSELPVLQALDRGLLVKQKVRELWLSILFVIQSMELVTQNKILYSTFYEDLQSQFSLGLIDNEDLVAAEIELLLFDEKLTELQQQQDNYRTLLSEWVGAAAYYPLPTDMPDWSATVNYINAAQHTHHQMLNNHPKSLLFKQSIKIANNQIELVEQDYKPSFKVEMGYGYRTSEMDDGAARPDLLSAFVTMDVPLFTDQKQDQNLLAAQHKKGQKQAEHRLLLRQLNAKLDSEIVNYKQLLLRQARYQDNLLIQAKLHTSLLEQSYQSNTRNFKDVIEAYMHEQTINLEYQRLYFDGLKTLARIRYYQAL